ncbi:hypothetical protein [Acinetobacter thermotolerans]|uniref:hypothetical protein n=1 Tax=Acinetobacter thermotolerans TaxID=3151487 RepID=UPI00325AB220
MKKILLSFIVGILTGVGILYLVLLFSSETLLTSITALNGEAPRPQRSLFNGKNEYSHEAEGKKIQHIEHLDEEQFQSASGNNADLYQLAGMCKLKISIYGETAYNFRTAYFHQNRLSYMFETQYRTSFEEFPDQKAPESKRIYQETVFNPNSELVQMEFANLLKKYVTPENQKKC